MWISFFPRTKKHQHLASEMLLNPDKQKEHVRQHSKSLFLKLRWNACVQPRDPGWFQGFPHFLFINSGGNVGLTDTYIPIPCLQHPTLTLKRWEDFCLHVWNRENFCNISVSRGCLGSGQSTGGSHGPPPHPKPLFPSLEFLWGKVLGNIPV